MEFGLTFGDVCRGALGGNAKKATAKLREALPRSQRDKARPG